jgi:hypothetical protein
MRFPSLLLLTLLMPSGVFAHGDAPSFEAETGGYLIDIGYDREGIRPGEEVTFDFDLLTTADRPQYVPFQSIDIDITRGSVQILQRSVQNDDTYIPTLPVTFDTEGAYHMHVAYIASGAVIAQSTFDLTVESSAGSLARTTNVFQYIAAAVLVCFAVCAVVLSYRRRS